MFNSKPPAGSPAARTVLQQAANPVQPDAAGVPANDAVGVAPGGSATIPLSKPITTHQGLVRELVLRPATFADFIAFGDIDTVVAGGFVDEKPTEIRTVVNYEAIMKWAVALTGLDRLVLAQLAPADSGNMVRAVRLALLPFSRGNS